MDKAVLRRLTLKALLSSPTTQFRSLANAVAGLATQQGILESDRTVRPGLVPLSEPKLSNDEETDLNEVVWDLIVERILTPGIDASNPEWPWLRMTERGRRIADKELGSIA